MCLMSINYYWCFDILGGYEGTLKAAEETKMLEQILQHELQLAPPELIEKLAKTYYVTVFAKSYCPYSKRVKEFFATSNVLFKAVDLDTLGEQGKEIQAVLREKNGQATVPSVWINGNFIGIELNSVLGPSLFISETLY